MENKKYAFVTLRLPEELKTKLQLEAKNKGYTIKDEIIFIFWEYFLKATAPE